MFYIKFEGGIILKIISVNIQKGGCGKTTTTQMLAEILNKDHSQKVLCIDTDPQCNLTTVSGVDLAKCQKNNFYTFLNTQSTLSECVIKTKYYDIVPSSILLSRADVEFGNISRDRYFIKQLQQLNYDFVLLDTPPALGYLNTLSLSVSSSVIVPTECSYLAMIGLDQLAGTIQTVKDIANPDLQVLGILMIKYSKTNLNNAVSDGLVEMSKSLNTTVFDSKIRETVKIREAQSQMTPIIDWAENCTAVSDYREFTKELLAKL